MPISNEIAKEALSPYKDLSTKVVPEHPLHLGMCLLWLPNLLRKNSSAKWINSNAK